MPTTAYLLSNLRKFHKGKSPLLALADDIGGSLRFLERVAERSGGEYPTARLLWDLYVNAVQTISGLRQHDGIVLPSLPTDPLSMPPRTRLARLRDWLIRASSFGNRPIDAGTAGEAGVTVGLKPLTVGQLEIWKLLQNRILTAKEIAIELLGDRTKEGAILKRICRMKKAGWLLDNTGQRGFYRPGAPPPDFQGF